MSRIDAAKRRQLLCVKIRCANDCNDATHVKRTLLIVAGLLWVSAAQGWFLATHRVSSQIAWTELTPNVKQEVVRLLLAHPRYSEDFARPMPPSIGQGDEAERHAWLFQQASVWPDIVRDVGSGDGRGRYNRSKWHYINWPLFLSEAEKQNLQDGIETNLEGDPAAAVDPKAMNIFQAINHNAAILKDRDGADADRSVALCWLVHLVQDIHQPLHTTALFTSNRFPAGDRGGNLIPLSGQGEIDNLHAFWDSMVSRSQSHEMIHRRAAFLTGRYSQIGSDATEAMSVDDWVGENNQLILRYVYTPEIRARIRRAEDSTAPLASIKVTTDYQDQAQQIAEIRVVEAGFRLAYLLNQLPVQ